MMHSFSTTPFVVVSLLATLAAGIVSGCGGDGHDHDDAPPQQTYSGPSGFFRGYVTLDGEAEVAAVDVAIDDNGNSTVTVVDDDSDAVSAIAIATAKGASSLTLQGSLHGSGASSDFAANNGSAEAQVLTASIDNVVLAGELNAQQQTLPTNVSVDGDYRFVDGSDRQWQATVAGTALTLTASGCSVSGTIDDGGSGLYRIALKTGTGTDCAGFTAAMKGAAHLASLEADNDVLHVSLAAAGSVLDTDWFR